MHAVIGTIPEEGFPLVIGEIRLEEKHILVGERRVPVNRGTPALLAATIKAGEVLDLPLPYGYLAGDIGRGDGSRRIYERLVEVLPRAAFSVITFHYLQPDVDWHNKVLFAVEEMTPRPVLIADAGFMYAAKMSGQSEAYDLFTPDAGELAFLADEEAPHPFYTRGFILHEEERVPEQMARAYDHGNAAQCLLVKGKRDFVADRNGIRTVVDHPSEEAMEAMGGTGDTVTGIVAALTESGMAVKDAAVVAARANRLAGSYAKPTPATQVMEIIMHIPRALEAVLSEEGYRHGNAFPEEDLPISPDMTVLDVVSCHRETEAVFRKYDEQAGACICCDALFETMRDVSKRYGLDLEGLLTDLESARTGADRSP
jgi:hypothetical protein